MEKPTGKLSQPLMMLLINFLFDGAALQKKCDRMMGDRIIFARREEGGGPFLTHFLALVIYCNPVNVISLDYG